jgi:hypothetical protein
MCDSLILIHDSLIQRLRSKLHDLFFELMKDRDFKISFGIAFTCLYPRIATYVNHVRMYVLKQNISYVFRKVGDRSAYLFALGAILPFIQSTYKYFPCRILHPSLLKSTTF